MKKIKRVILFNVFLLLIASSHLFFGIENNIAMGDVVGLSLIISNFWTLGYSKGFDVGLISLVLNIPLIIYAWINHGQNFVMRSIYGIFALPIFILGIERIFHYLSLGVSSLPLWIAAIFAGILSGIGMGGLNILGGSSGGVEILGGILHKMFPKISWGGSIAFSAIAIAFLGGEYSFYSIFAILLSGTTFDAVVSSLKVRD